MGGAASAVGVANPPWPCTAGGRHVSKPRLRQGQLPNGRYRPRGISGLTNRAAPPALYLGRLDARRNGLDALGHAADAGRRRFDRLGRLRRLAAKTTGSAAPRTPGTPLRAAQRPPRAARSRRRVRSSPELRDRRAGSSTQPRYVTFSYFCSERI